MNPLKTIRLKFRSLWVRCAAKQEIDDELQFHLDQRTAENTAAGMPPEEAARVARKRFGNLQSVREECREKRGANFGETLWQDLRFGGRMLLKNPGFTAVAVLSLAVGIGINTTIFSALDAVFLRPLYLHNTDDLVRFEQPLFKYDEYRELQSNLRSVSDLVAVSHHVGMLREDEGTSMLTADYVSRNYFTALRVQPAAGSLFSEADARVGDAPTVVISYGLWQRRYGGDLNIVGQSIPLFPQAATVLGVAAKGFGGLERVPACDLWFPQDPVHGSMAGDMRDFELFGRVRPGSTAPQVQAEVETLASHLAWDLPKPRAGQFINVVTQQQHESAHGGEIGWFVMAVVGLVLLVACANVSSLLLARYEDRRRELAVRMALGGGRVRLLRQLLVEGLLLSTLGSLAGLLVTVWAIQLIPLLIPSIGIPFLPELRVNVRVL